MENRTERLKLPPAARWAYRVALACGALPLLTGTTIFLLWISFGWNWLEEAGIYTLVGGCAAFAVGTALLAGFWVRTSCWPGFPHSRRRRLMVGAALLLIANFPTAGGVVAAVMALQTCYVVVVENHSASALDAVRVTGGGCEAGFGRIAPGRTRRRWFWIQRTGELTLRATRDGTPVIRMVDGYVTGGMGARTVATVEPDGTVSVRNDDDRSQVTW